MKINTVTITGADNNVSWTDLWLLQDQYPFVEWGILFSKSKEGQARYPSLDKILRLKGNADGFRLSAHFCGWYSREILENKNYELFSIYNQFQRFQLNYNFQASAEYDVLTLVKHLIKNPQISVILQFNKANFKVLLPLLGGDVCPDNIHVLYDSSGGRGKEISEVQEPFELRYTGYSGGLNTENIKPFCDKIEKHGSEDVVWLDMESGVRTGNEFDLKKVRSVLEQIEPFADRRKFTISHWRKIWVEKTSK